MFDVIRRIKVILIVLHLSRKSSTDLCSSFFLLLCFLRTPEGAVHDVVVINVYCPRADRENKERMSYKLQFYNLLQLRAEALVHEGR